MIEVTKPDLILLDYEMPVCSGAQFLEMLHSEAQTKDIPVIFLTSRSDEETVRKVLELGPQGYLLKSQSKENIVEAISKFFAKDMYEN
ncbi:MAG: response regulator [Clostridia bacterium]|nr:response regulator [Clostridia bacterium]